MMKQVTLKVKKLDKNAIIPKYQTKGAACFDISANIKGGLFILAAKSFATIPTGLAVEVPFGYELKVLPRSGLAANHGITVLNSPGTVDFGFKNELRVILVNHSDKDFVIEDNFRIAQGCLREVIFTEFEEVEELTGYDRGGGFGSSGR